jgi:hypothetical protein
MDSVELALVAQDGTWKAEIFRRPNGTYGFRASRWVAKEKSWLQGGCFSGSVTPSAEAAEMEARARVPQLGKTGRRIAVPRGEGGSSVGADA